MRTLDSRYQRCLYGIKFRGHIIMQGDLCNTIGLVMLYFSVYVAMTQLQKQGRVCEKKHKPTYVGRNNNLRRELSNYG